MTMTAIARPAAETVVHGTFVLRRTLHRPERPDGALGPFGQDARCGARRSATESLRATSTGETMPTRRSPSNTSARPLSPLPIRAASSASASSGRVRATSESG